MVRDQPDWRGQYPALEPFHSEMLEVGDGHQLYVEQCGNKNGKPALFLHGGPGGGCSPDSRRFFDPEVYHIVVFDQRGCGRSKPNAADDWRAALKNNTTQELVQDCDRIRRHLGVAAWHVVQGGSWGSTLALAYAEAFPDTVKALVLRGVFLFSEDEVSALFCEGHGTKEHHPDAWQRYTEHIPAEERDNKLGAYLRLLTGSDTAVAEAAAREFVRYELSISKSFLNHQLIDDCLNTPSKLIPFALFEVTYMLEHGFMRRGQLLDGAEVLKDKPVYIVQGRCDFVCRPSAAWKLAQRLKSLGNTRVDLNFVDGAGHSNSEPGIVDGLVKANDALRALEL